MSTVFARRPPKGVPSISPLELVLLITGMFFFASPPLDYDHRDVAHQQKLLTDAFAGAAWEVPWMLTAMADAPNFYFDSLSQVHLPCWWRDRTVLVGDATDGASPASGQGTSLALVGAYVLAGELRVAAGDHRAAFARYQVRMREFVEQNQKLGPSNIKGIVMRSRPQLWFQLQALRCCPTYRDANASSGVLPKHFTTPPTRSHSSNIRSSRI